MQVLREQEPNNSLLYASSAAIFARLCARNSPILTQVHPGVELRANLKSISRRCYPREEAFEQELTQGTIYLPLGCLQGGQPQRRRGGEPFHPHSPRDHVLRLAFSAMDGG